MESVHLIADAGRSALAGWTGCLFVGILLLLGDWARPKLPAQSPGHSVYFAILCLRGEHGAISGVCHWGTYAGSHASNPDVRSVLHFQWSHAAPESTAPVLDLRVSHFPIHLLRGWD